MYTLGRKAVERHVLTCAATSMHGIKLTREKMIGKHFSRHGPKGLTKLPSISNERVAGDAAPPVHAAGASMNLIWHLGQQPEVGYSAKRVRASSSVALHTKR